MLDRPLRQVLHALVARKGPELHLSYYLGEIAHGILHLSRPAV